MSKNFENILQGISEHGITFNTQLLSDKSQIVSFSPMTVKDQKALLINTETESYINQIKALVQLLKSCIKSSPIKVEDMFIQDFIWIVINLRMKSIGENVEVMSTCQHCHERNYNTKINFEKNLIKTYLEGLKDNIIQVTPELKLILSFPRIKHLLNKKENSTNLDVLADEIDYLEFKDETIDLTDAEKVKLLETLDLSLLKNFETFENNNNFGIILQFDFKCSSCSKVNNIEIKENVLDFF